MSRLTLISSRKQSLKPVVEAALNNELRLLDAGVKRTEKKLKLFETQFGMTTTAFLKRYENNEFQETLEFAEWVGEYRMLFRLKEKTQALREVQFAD